MYVPNVAGYSPQVDRQNTQAPVEPGHPWMRLVGSATLWCATCQVPAVQCRKYRENEYPASQPARG